MKTQDQNQNLMLLHLVRKENYTLMKQGQLLSPAEEDLLYTGILDAYDGKPYRDPRQLLTHRLTILIPLDGDWYRLGFLLGQTLRNSERN
jgi:hypothetical protein